MKSKTAKVKGVPISLSCLYTNVPLFYIHPSSSSSVKQNGLRSLTSIQPQNPTRVADGHGLDFIIRETRFQHSGNE